MTESTSKFRRMSEVEPKSTEWLWARRIPLGELTVVDGDPGINKSSFLLDLAARVSSHREMIDGSPGVGGGVILLLGEDSIAKTVRRRLEVAQADLSRIAVLDQQVLMPRDLDLIERAVLRVSAKLIIIDPLMAFLTSDSNSDQKVRMALTPLAAVAERTNAAVVLVRHLNKRGGKHSLYRGSGSIGIIAATRSGLLIGRSPDDPNFRVICHTKCNLGPLAPSLLFEPVDADGVPQIEWRGECEYSADDVLTPKTHNESRLAEAMAFLQEVLANEPVEQKEIKRLAAITGLAYRTVERAKEFLDVLSIREGWGPGSKCFWQLPAEETVEPHSTPNDPAWRAINDKPNLKLVGQTKP